MKSLIISSASAIALAGAAAHAEVPAKGPEAVEHLNEMEYQRINAMNEAMPDSVTVAVVTPAETKDVAAVSTQETRMKQEKNSTAKDQDKTWTQEARADREFESTTDLTTTTKDQRGELAKANWHEDAKSGVGGEYYATKAEAERDAYLDATIAEIAMSDPQFSTLVDLVQMAGLDDKLNSAGEFTVFAPTNAAFAKLGADKLESLKNDPSELERILKAHVVPGIYMASDVPSERTELETIGKAKLYVEKDENGMVMASASTVDRADIVASNGVIHVIDQVIIPEYEDGSVLPTTVGR